MSVRKKLNFVFFTLSTLMLIAVIFASVQFFRIGNEVSNAVDIQMAQIQRVNDIQQNLLSQSISARAYTIDPSQKNLDALSLYSANLNSLISEIELQNTIKDASGPIANLKDQLILIDNQIINMTAAMAKRDVSLALSIINGDYNYTSSFAHELTEKVKELETSQLNIMVSQTKSNINLSTIVSIVFIFITLIVACFYMFYTKRGITKPLQTISQDLEQMANGNLAIEHTPIKAKDEIGKLSRAFIALQQNFDELLTHIQFN